MEKFINSIQKKLSPIAVKMAENIYLRALSEAMQSAMPIIMLGSFACLFAFIKIDAWQGFLTQVPALKSVFMTVQSLTLSIISIYIVFLVSARLSAKIDLDPITTGAVSLATFLLVTPHEVYKSIPSQWLGYSGMFTAIILGFAVPMFIRFCYKKNIVIKMPEGVPKIVENALALVVPCTILFGLAAVSQVLLPNTPLGSLHNIIYTVIQTPIKNIGLTLPGVLFVKLLMALFMFTGIHGSTVGAFLTPLETAADAENLAAFTSALPLPNAVTGAMKIFCFPGGIGATLGLAILMLFVVKSSRLKTLGRMSIIPSLFAINEPLLFGIPILLNPVLLIPYILNPFINILVGYGSVVLGLIPRFPGIAPDWTVPPILNGLIAQGWQTAVLQVVLIVTNVVIWYPFLKIVDKGYVEEENKQKNLEAHGESV